MAFERIRKGVVVAVLGLALVLAPGPRGAAFGATLVLGFDDLPAAPAPVPVGYGSLT